MEVVQKGVLAGQSKFLAETLLVLAEAYLRSFRLAWEVQATCYPPKTPSNRMTFVKLPCFSTRHLHQTFDQITTGQLLSCHAFGALNDHKASFDVVEIDLSFGHENG